MEIPFFYELIIKFNLIAHGYKDKSKREENPLIYKVPPRVVQT